MFEIERQNKDQVHEEPNRISWPWKNMGVGDLVRISDKTIAGKAQVNCHVYGRFTYKKFKTETIGGVLHVWRIK